jgi:DNA-binding IclR family transcriptional regulator
VTASLLELLDAKRRGRTVGEFARRWHVTEATALGFLEHFARRGIAVESRGLWYGTAERRGAAIGSWWRHSTTTTRHCDSQ